MPELRDRGVATRARWLTTLLLAALCACADLPASEPSPFDRTPTDWQTNSGADGAGPQAQPTNGGFGSTGGGASPLGPDEVLSGGRGNGAEGSSSGGAGANSNVGAAGAGGSGFATGGAPAGGVTDACLVEFSVTTAPAGGRFSPSHVWVLWVSTVDDAFVDTVELWTNERTEYLTTWVAETGAAGAARFGEGIPDINTQATAPKHKAHNVAWDCRDSNGQLVPAGIYKARMEFTEARRQGPLLQVAMHIGAGIQQYRPAGSEHFRELRIRVAP